MTLTRTAQVDDCVAKYLWMKEMLERVAKVRFQSIVIRMWHSFCSGGVETEARCWRSNGMRT